MGCNDVGRARVRLFYALFVHALRYLLANGTLVLYLAVKAFRFFIPLAIIWFLNTVWAIRSSFTRYRRPKKNDRVEVKGKGKGTVEQRAEGDEKSWEVRLDDPGTSTQNPVMVQQRNITVLGFGDKPKPLTCFKAFQFIGEGILHFDEARVMWDVYLDRMDAAVGPVIQKTWSNSMKTHLSEPLNTDFKDTATRPDKERLFGGKIFENIATGFAFGLFNFYAVFLMDNQGSKCSFRFTQRDVWVGPKDFGVTEEVFMFQVRRMLFVAACASILSMAVAITELDYRISSRVHSRIEDSTSCTILHIIARGSEVGYQMMLMASFGLVMRDNANWWEEDVFGIGGMVNVAMLFWPPIVFGICNVYILVKTNKQELSLDSFASPVSIVIVGVTSIVVNPFKFLDAAGYINAARTASHGLYKVQGLQFVFVLMFYVAAMFFRFPSACTTLPDYVRNEMLPAEELEYIEGYQQMMWRSFAFFVILYVICLAITEKLFPQDSFTNQQALVMGVRQPSRDKVESLKEAVQAEVLTMGLSSFVLSSGGGFKLRKEFIVESKLGEGSYGIAALVTQRTYFSKGASYAVKLIPSDRVNKDAKNEVRIHEQISHPFATHLIHYWELDPSQSFTYASDPKRKGQQVRMEDEGELQNENDFGLVILMELCKYSLEDYITNARTMEHQAAMKQSRQFGAELANVLSWLHALDTPVIYRDLKPDNVLVIQNPNDNMLHVSLTDFGGCAVLDKKGTKNFEKMGNPYAAPEAWEVFMSQNPEAEKGYDEQMDVWAFGVVLLLMLAKFGWEDVADCISSDSRPYGLRVDVALKRSAEKGDSIPVEALDLLKSILINDPSKRLTMKEVEKHNFFTKPIEGLDAINMRTLLKSAQGTRCGREGFSSRAAFAWRDPSDGRSP